MKNTKNLLSFKIKVIYKINLSISTIPVQSFNILPINLYSVVQTFEGHGSDPVVVERERGLKLPQLHVEQGRVPPSA